MIIGMERDELRVLPHEGDRRGPPALERWVGFSDEELHELRHAALERHNRQVLPAAVRELAGRLATELRLALKAREEKTPTYRGPGRYRSVDEVVHEVLGVLGDLVIVRSPLAKTKVLVSVTRREFEGRGVSGGRLYEYLGPLDEAPHTANCVSKSEVAAALDEAGGTVPVGHAARVLGLVRERLLGSEF